MPLVPTVVERSPAGERAFDLYSRLLDERIVFLGSAIDDDVANLVVGQLLHLAARSPRDDIRLYVNSPGGSVTAGLAIYDTMQLIDTDVQTVCLGQAASFAALLVAAGAPGKRMVLPNARVLLHQPHVQGIGGQTTDVEIQAREMGRARRRIEQLFSHHTGQSVERIHADLERDFILGPDESVDYGVADRVLQPTVPSTGTALPATT